MADPEAEACRLYGVYAAREMSGVVKAAVARKTFIIGRDGHIHHIIDDAGGADPAADPTTQVIELLKQLHRSRNGNRQEHRRHA